MPDHGGDIVPTAAIVIVVELVRQSLRVVVELFGRPGVSNGGLGRMGGGSIPCECGSAWTTVNVACAVR